MGLYVLVYRHDTVTKHLFNVPTFFPIENSVVARQEAGLRPG